MEKIKNFGSNVKRKTTAEISEEISNDETFELNIVKKFKHWQSSGKFTDLILISDSSKRYHVHRLFIFAMIPEFEKIWINGKSPLEYKIGLTDYNLKIIIDYCYNNITTFEFNVDLIILLQFCDKYKLVDLYKRIMKSISNEVSNGKSLVILNKIYDDGLSKSSAIENLQRQCIEHLIESFGEVFNEPEFLKISPTNLSNILSSDRLMVESEEIVLEALLKWYFKKQDFTLQSDPIHTNRVVGMENALQTIRLSFISKDIVLKFRHVWENNNCKNYIYNYAISMLENSISPIRQVTFDYLRPATVENLLMIHYEHQSIHMEILKSKNQTWKILPNIPCQLFQSHFIHGDFTKADNENLILIGGDEIVQNKDAWCLNLKTMTFRNMKEMNMVRGGAGVSTIAGCIYVAGGYCGGRLASESVERYNFQNDEWEIIASMREQRAEFKLIAVENVLYAIGGEKGCSLHLGSSVTNTMESYNVEENLWKYEESMKHCRRCFGAARHGNYIYVVGGSNGTGEIQYVERFDLIAKIWYQIASLSTKRDFLSVVVFENQLFAIGGYNSDHKKLKDVEAYDEHQDKWTKMASLNVTAGGSGAFIVKGHINKIFNE